MKKTKLALFHSVIALMLCCSMLVGTTYAWFTDSVESANNVIKAGNLDVELQYSFDCENWAYVGADPIIDDTLWEPGHTEVVYLRVENAGTLALKYHLGINIVDEKGSYNQDRKAFLLSDYIQFGVVENVTAAYGTREAARAAVTSAKKISAGFDMTGSVLKGATDEVVALVVYMPEDVGNVANHATGVDAPEIKLGVNVYATQEMDESDTFDEEYDNNAAADFFPGFQGGSAGAVVSADDQGVTTAAAEMAGGDVSAVIPAGVLLADGKTSLGLSVVTKESSDANIQLGENEEMRPLDVHMEGVGENNTVPMLITLKHYLTTGINTGALKLYHVENGATVAMTQVDGTPVNHNEFSYDPLTGDVTLALASFSEVAVIADTTNTWNGVAATSFAGGKGTEAEPYLIANASQLAYFRNEVDGGRHFDNEFVQLTTNITLSNVNFDPIGWGYEYNDWNVGDVAGKPFKGTFDGNGKVILDLYQSGWDLEKATGTDYTYTNCGFGLFAAAADATFKNLTIYGANIRVECVEVGILVGLSQGSCTYDNITIANSKVANYQRPTGGLIGEVSPLNGGGETKITNVVIGSDVVVGSLWGDFDAPCGGVIGARWDDTNKTTVVMETVTVGCRMDVYSDVTSAYQWYAYRRAGMLIGNTELTVEGDPHRADAPFLTCVVKDGVKTVKVYYGDWAAYHYCQFTNQDNEWCNNYPWVRVEAGENCSAYSNPRYGQPVINGATVTTHDAGTCTGEHNMELRFNQLYGGGQGVYGQPVHDLNGDGENDVEVINYQYSISYINDSQVLAIRYITEKEAENIVYTSYQPAQDLVLKWATENMTEDYGEVAFGGWMTAASVKLTEIPEKNTQNIVLYPYFGSPHTASFVDQDSTVLAWCFFNETNVRKLAATFATAKQNRHHPGEDFVLDYWKIRGEDEDGNRVEATLDKDNPDWNSFTNFKMDVTITPHYKYMGADLIEVYDDLTGEIDHYQVAGYADGTGSKLVEIPDYVNGAPVTTINSGAFKSYDDLYAAKIPANITSIGEKAFTEQSGTKRDQVTLYYQGDPDDWKHAMDELYVTKPYSYYTDYNTAGTYAEAAKLKLDSSWDSGAGDGSRIFFLDADGNVDQNAGYWELYDAGMKVVSKEWYGNKYGTVYVWIYHNHPYDNTLDSYGDCSNEDTHYKSFTDYDAADRPDREYWIP